MRKKDATFCEITVSLRIINVIITLQSSDAVSEISGIILYHITHLIYMEIRGQSHKTDFFCCS